MSFLRKMFNKSEWDYVADFKDGYALAVCNEHKTVYLIDENYEIAGSMNLKVCLYAEKSVKKAISNNCKYLAAQVSKDHGNISYYTFLDTQLKYVEGHKYNKILYYVPGKSAIVVETNGDIYLLDGELKKDKLICCSDDRHEGVNQETNFYNLFLALTNRYGVVNQEYFYFTNEKTLKLVNTKTREIKEFEGNHIEEVADGEFYRIRNTKDGDMYYDKNFNPMENYESVRAKDKHGRIPIVLKNGDIFIYHCN